MRFGVTFWREYFICGIVYFLLHLIRRHIVCLSLSLVMFRMVIGFKYCQPESSIIEILITGG